MCHLCMTNHRYYFWPWSFICPNRRSDTRVHVRAHAHHTYRRHIHWNQKHVAISPVCTLWWEGRWLGGGENGEWLKTIHEAASLALFQKHLCTHGFSLNLQEISHKPDLNSYFRNLSPWILSFLEIVEAKYQICKILKKFQQWWLALGPVCFGRTNALHKFPVKSEFFSGEGSIHWALHPCGHGWELIVLSWCSSSLCEHGEVDAILSTSRWGPEAQIA